MDNDHKIFNKEDPFKEIEFEAEIETKSRDKILEELEEQEQETEEQEENPELAESVRQYHKAHNQYHTWKSLFNDIFLEVYDSEKSFYDSKEGYTDKLLNTGIKVDPNEMYDLIELVNSRMTRISVAKRLASAMGLHYEWPRILEKELELIYNSRKDS